MERLAREPQYVDRYCTRLNVEQRAERRLYTYIDERRAAVYAFDPYFPSKPPRLENEAAEEEYTNAGGVIVTKRCPRFCWTGWIAKYYKERIPRKSSAEYDLRMLAVNGIRGNPQ